MLEKDKADKAFNVTENKTWESLKWEIWEFGNEGLMRVWSNARNESEREKRNETLVKFGFSNSEWQFCIAENDKKLQSRDPLEYKSIVIQKRCCNNICQVAWTTNFIAVYSWVFGQI